MIWSIVPESLIFAETHDAVGSLRLTEYLGRKVLIRRLSSGKAEIVSLLSTEPSDFLVKSLHPGSVIDMR